MSHYTRKKSTKKYLSAELSVHKMHFIWKNMKLKLMRHGNTIKKIQIKYEFYLHIFNTKFNLSFGKPKSDVCNRCDIFKNQIEAAIDHEEKTKLNRNHSLHLTKANKFYSDLKHLTELAKTDEHMDVISFDYQQNLPVPMLPIGDIFLQKATLGFQPMFLFCKI